MENEIIDLKGTGELRDYIKTNEEQLYVGINSMILYHGIKKVTCMGDSSLAIGFWICYTGLDFKGPKEQEAEDCCKEEKSCRRTMKSEKLCDCSKCTKEMMCEYSHCFKGVCKDEVRRRD